MGAKEQTEAERISAVVLESLDEEGGAGDLARRAYRSRSDFFRVFRAVIEESPGAMRRRLLLERAAWQLGRTRVSVTEIAFNANYGSLEGFTRAFRKAFRVSPSLYRRMGATHIQLPASNGIHFCAPGGRRSEGAIQDMDLFDIFAGHESWHTRQLLEVAATLSDEQLDRPLNNKIKVFPWDSPDQNLRQIFDRVVQTKEVWTAALTGGSAPDTNASSKDSPAAMLARLAKVDEQFNGFMREVRNRGAWDDTFVDALCEPPETFTFGGTFAHVVTFNSYRRLVAMDALRCLGVAVPGFGCPSEYEATLK